MCVALREGRTQTAADPNTIKMDRVFVSVRMCVCTSYLHAGVRAGCGIRRSGNHHRALDILGQITLEMCPMGSLVW